MMAQNDLIKYGIGAGVIGLGLWLFLRNRGGSGVTFQYVAGQDSADDSTASMILENVDFDKVIKTDYNIENINSDMVLLGGRLANPRSVGFLVNIGVIPPLTLGENHARIDAINYKGYNVWVVRGTTSANTFEAASAFIQKPFPNSTQVLY